MSKVNWEKRRCNDEILLFLTILLGMLLPFKTLALNDFQTDNPKLTVVRSQPSQGPNSEDVEGKCLKAEEWIHQNYREWQLKYGKIRRHLEINLVPVERELVVGKQLAEGVWNWKSFKNEEGTAVLGIGGDLYVNINSTSITQRALVAHECSHAFLMAYHPKILESNETYRMFNEGLAELFSVEYEPSPWKNWHKVVLAHRFHEAVQMKDLSSYAWRILNVLRGKPTTPHDLGFFYLYVVRDGKVELDRDLKECTNDFIQNSIREWTSHHPDEVDLPMIHE